jgi:hypothetical protein
MTFHLLENYLREAGRGKGLPGRGAVMRRQPLFNRHPFGKPYPVYYQNISLAKGLVPRGPRASLVPDNSHPMGARSGGVAGETSLEWWTHNFI